MSEGKRKEGWRARVTESSRRERKAEAGRREARCGEEELDNEGKKEAGRKMVCRSRTRSEG